MRKQTVILLGVLLVILVDISFGALPQYTITAISGGGGDTAVSSATLDDDGDTMTFETSGGAGIQDATVRAYVKSEYDSSGTAATVRATVTTLADGSWDGMMLSSGVQYTITFDKAGYALASTTVTVS